VTARRGPATDAVAQATELEHPFSPASQPGWGGLVVSGVGSVWEPDGSAELDRPSPSGNR
jgi:hypothetical protein